MGCLGKDIEKDYVSLYRAVSCGALCVVFIKKTGEYRVMLCSREPDTIKAFGCLDSLNELAGHDKRAGIHNGNIACIDVMIGEPRTFNVERLITAYDFGPAKNPTDAEGMLDTYNRYKEKYDGIMQGSLTFDNM